MAEGQPRRPRPPAAPATFGVFALSGSVDPARLEEGVARLQASGHRVVVAPQSLARWRYFAGTDEERLAGFHRLLDDPAIDVMMPARGGYGITRVLAQVDWPKVGASGKVFCGFSDFTAFNCAALAHGGLSTLHGPMLSVDFGDGEPDAYMLGHFAASLWGTEDSETVACDHGCEAAAIAGTLWGGNLSVLAHLAGTPYLPAVDGGLLYLEEIDRRLDDVENRLEDSIENSEMLELLRYEKSLVHIKTGLEWNDIMVQHLQEKKYFGWNDDDRELFEDVRIEYQQGFHMADTKLEMLEATTDAFASLISNNLNVVMKFLAAVTIVLTMPMIVASIYGMNVALPGESNPVMFVVLMVFSLALTLGVAWWFQRQGWLSFRWRRKRRE